MQMMPASAKLAAHDAGLPYRPEALLTDTTYNIELGMTEYHGHLDRFGGSWVLAIASYNAGPNNVKRWLAANGDPRVTDPMDWIEQIPFGETRNYVQRVSGEYRGLPGAAGGQGCAAADIDGPLCAEPAGHAGVGGEIISA